MTDLEHVQPEFAEAEKLRIGTCLLRTRTHAELRD